MRKGRDLAHDLDRLVAASSMFATQEWERSALGDDQDYDDAKQETHDVVRNVLDVIEKSMDEDLLERLDSGDYPRLASSYVGCMPRYTGWRTWPYTYYGAPTYRRTVAPRRATARRKIEMLDQVLDDFRADFESRLKRARRDDRPLSEAELDEALQELREDLKVVARRSRRREERRDERDTRRDED